MDKSADNKILAGLGEYIRPLLSEAGNAMGMENAGFIGICFPNPYDSTSKVLFAEYVNPINRLGSYEGNYILPEGCAFLRAIAISAQENSVWHYVVSSDEPAAVIEPFAKEFPHVAEPQALFAQKLDTDGGVILYFISASEKIFAEFPEKFQTARKFLIKTLRDALFLAATAAPHLVGWSDKLIAKLPEVFPTYSVAQKHALAKVRHPYLQWQEGLSEVPIVEGNFHEKDKDLVQAIRGAVRVKGTGLLSGSFQDHNVYSAKVFPGRAARMFEAAIKFAPQSRADREIRGYFSLLPYFREIREVMPSAPLVFPTGRKVEDKNGVETAEDKYIVVTPHLGGQSLYDFIQKNWSEDVDRVPKLRDVFLQLRQFLENIRPEQGLEEQVAPCVRLYESHLSKQQRQKGNRFDKTKRQFIDWMPDGLDATPLLSALGDEVCNPLWLLANSPLETEIAKFGAFWQTSLRERRIVRFGHGDFHVGNVLFIPNESRVTVLDFDYVAEHPEHEDPATLETSFVLAVAASSCFQDKANWTGAWPDTIRFLSGKLPWKAVQNNRLAHDIAQLVAAIRKKEIPHLQNFYMADDHHYHACLVTALLRLFTSHSKKMDLVQFRPVGATAFFWLGLLLKGLVRCPVVENPPEIDLFDKLRKPATVA